MHPTTPTHPPPAGLTSPALSPTPALACPVPPVSYPLSHSSLPPPLPVSHRAPTRPRVPPITPCRPFASPPRGGPPSYIGPWPLYLMLNPHSVKSNFGQERLLSLPIITSKFVFKASALLFRCMALYRFGIQRSEPLSSWHNCLIPPHHLILLYHKL